MVTGEEEVVEEPEYDGVDRSTFKFLTEVRLDSKTELTADLTLARPMKAVIEFLDNPHGSVRLSQGDTCVMAAFYGPSDVRISKELPHRAAVDVFYRPKITGSSKAAQAMGLDPQIEERAMENIIASILETTIFLLDDPGAGFNIVLQEYENDGCLLATCLNAAFVSALDGSCSLRSMIAAVTVAVMPEDTLIVDPSSSQLKEGYKAMVTYVFTNDNKILYTYMQGRARNEVLALALKCARLAVVDMFSFYGTIVRRKYLK
jgi:exosome complex component RRP46